MGKGAKIIIALAVILVLLGGVVLFSRQTNTTPKEEQAKTNVSPDVADSDTPVAATITLTGSGFEPRELTVQAGETIEVKNNSSEAIQLSSDPHPVHTDNEELNVGFISPGQSQKFTLNQPGMWGYHDHLNESLAGSVNVE